MMFYSLGRFKMIFLFPLKVSVLSGFGLGCLALPFLDLDVGMVGAPGPLEMMVISSWDSPISLIRTRPK